MPFRHLIVRLARERRYESWQDTSGTLARIPLIRVSGSLLAGRRAAQGRVRKCV
jgi:hypothetical protein